MWLGNEEFGFETIRHYLKSIYDRSAGTKLYKVVP